MTLHLFRSLLAAAIVGCAGASTSASTLTAASPLFVVPDTLFDPLGQLTSLTPEQFVVPIVTADAMDLQDWGFDLLYDADIAAPSTIGGLYVSLYQALFDEFAASSILSSGFDTPGQLDDVFGTFEYPVSGSGTVAYVLFEYLEGQVGRDPGLTVLPPDASSVPLPGTLPLALLALAASAASATRIRHWAFTA